jgi:hypothetical protein
MTIAEMLIELGAPGRGASARLTERPGSPILLA